MISKVWSDLAWEDYVYWQSQDKKILKRINLLLKDIDRNQYEDADTGAEAYLWECVKWYDDFKEVSFLEELMQELNEQDYLFIRTGEDYDDTEVQGYFWDNPFDLKLSRAINICEVI